MHRLLTALAVLGLSTALFAQPVSVPIINPSFEDPPLADGGFTSGGDPAASPGWLRSSATAGLLNPLDTLQDAHDGNNVLWLNENVIAVQTLGVNAVPGTCTLSVYVNHRINNEGVHLGPNPYDIELLVNDVPVTADSKTLPTTLGTEWVEATATYTIPEGSPLVGGRLGIRLTSGGVQQHFDAVSLTWTSFAGTRNLLWPNGNPSFTSPVIAGPDCPTTFGPIDAWTSVNAHNSGGIRNGTWGVPDCPPDHAYATIDNQSGEGYYYQTVTGLTPGTSYTFTGYWAMTVFNGPSEFSAEIHSGTDPNANLLNRAVESISPTVVRDDWMPFAVQATTPPGVDTLTLVFRHVASGGSGGRAFHIDDVSLFNTNCPTLPAITSVSPAYALREPNVEITVSGTGFSAGANLTLRRTGHADIPGTVTFVNSSTLTATFDLSSADLGAWDLHYSSTGCPPDSLASAVTVILPAFTNGSFESPAVGACTPAAGLPTDWSAFEVNAWKFENRLNLNGYIFDESPLTVLPTCPPPDGDQYATMASRSTGVGAASNAYQTFQVTPGATYTLSGYFAGSGDTRATLSLFDGAPGGTLLGEQIIHEGSNPYDWQFGFVTGQADSSVMTAQWSVRRLSGNLSAGHADALQLEECVSQAFVNTVNPGNGANNGTLEVTISGGGFTGTPTVFLSKPGALIPATVTNVTANQLKVELPLTGVGSGKYDLLVKQGGCITTVPQGFAVVAQALINGSFEDPEAPQTACVEENPIALLPVPTGWNFEGELIRDAAVHTPSCPLPDGLHYGSMTQGESAPRRAWQTIRVQPGQDYTFSGWFAGNGENTVTIRLLEGDENGFVIASKVIALNGSTWVFDEVTGSAAGNTMTVEWSMTNLGAGPHAAHADGLTFVPVGATCNDPSMDADGDGDVDQADFGVWQSCFTGSNGSVPEGPAYDYCHCFDRDGGVGDGDIDQIDLSLFENCASGPAIPADPACDGSL